MSMVEFTTKRHVGTLLLNRPKAANALNWEMVRQLEEIYVEVAETDIEVVVVRSSGNTFSAGLDRREMEKFLHLSPESQLQERFQFYARLSRSMQFPVPSIAIVEAAALTGGVGLAVLCDFRLASTHAWFKVTFNELGFYPGLGLSATLQDVAGSSLARRMLLLGERIDAAEAHRVGLVDWLVEPDEIDSKLHEILSLVGSGDKFVVRMMRDRLNSGRRNGLETALHEEALCEAFNAQTDRFKVRAERFIHE